MSLDSQRSQSEIREVQVVFWSSTQRMGAWQCVVEDDLVDWDWGIWVMMAQLAGVDVVMVSADRDLLGCGIRVQ